MLAKHFVHYEISIFCHSGNFDNEYLIELVSSQPKRIFAVFKTLGGPNKY